MLQLKAEGSAQHGLDILARELMEAFLPNVSVLSSHSGQESYGGRSSP